MSRKSTPKPIQTNFRTSDTMRDRLQAAADARGISVNKEINDRLEWSFDDSRRADLIFQNQRLYGILKVIAVAMDTAGTSVNAMQSTLAGSADKTDWPDNPQAFRQAAQAAMRIFEIMTPEQKTAAPK